MSGRALMDRFFGGGNGLRQATQRVVFAEDAYHRPPGTHSAIKAVGIPSFLVTTNPRSFKKSI